MTEVDLGIPALASLLPTGIAFGMATSFVFARFSDHDAIRRSANKMLAHLLELRLFQDEPRVVLRAQANLMIENLRLLRLLVRPALIAALPAIVVFAQVDAFYARAPLRVGEPAVVTLQFNASLPDEAPKPIPPPGIQVETPPVRVLSERQISWRIRPVDSASGMLRFVWPDHETAKSIRSGTGIHYLPTRGGSIEIDYPRAEILRFNWLVWFLISCSAGAALYFAFRLRSSRA